MLKHTALYALSGAIGTAAHYFLFWQLLTISCPPSLAAGCGALVGLKVNFWLCRLMVFTDSGIPFKTQAGRYLLVAIVLAACNAGIVALLLSSVGAWTAQIVATILTPILGFFCNRSWTFARSKQQ